MKIDNFDNVSLAIGCIASCLLCVSASIRGDEKPQNDIIADAVYYLSTQAYDLEKAMDRLISENLKEKRQLKDAADKNRLKLKLSDFPTAAEIPVRERTKEKGAV